MLFHHSSFVFSNRVNGQYYRINHILFFNRLILFALPLTTRIIARRKAGVRSAMRFAPVIQVRTLQIYQG